MEAFIPHLPLPSRQPFSHRNHCPQATLTPQHPSQTSPKSVQPAQPIPAPPPPAPARTSTQARKTNESSVTVSLNLDGTGRAEIDTSIPFLDHMLHQLCSHGLLDISLRARGDTHIDDHHTNEDIAITLGLALRDAIVTRGITRFGHFVAPLDEALVEVVLDFSGRGHCSYGLQLPTDRVGTYDTQLVREFFHAVASNAQITLHIIQRSGVNSHHIIEATFKAFARALRMAIARDPRQKGVPSSKGTLSDEEARV